MKKLIFAATAVLAFTLSTSTANAQIFQLRFPCLFPRLVRSCSPCSQGYCSPCSQVSNVEYAPRPCAPCSTCSQAPTACEPCSTCSPCSCSPCAGGSCKVEEAETEQLPAAPESAPSPCDPCGDFGYSTECSDGRCTLTDPVEACGPCEAGSCSTTSASCGSCANALVERLNATRARLGYSRFEFDATLERGASYQASVCRSYGRLIHAGGVAEILAQSSSLDGAIQQWLASPPHRALLLSNYRRAGVGVVRDAYGRSWYAVQFR